MSSSLRIVCVGWGAIMRLAAALIAERVPTARIVGIAVRGEGDPRSGWPDGARLLHGPEDLTPGFTDMVIEAANTEAVEPWGMAALQHARVFVPLSISALVAEGRLERLTAVAKRYGSQIAIPSGAIGGIDALRAASFAGLDSVIHEIIKPVAAWQGTPAAALVDLATLQQPVTFLKTTARKAASDFPQNANVAGLVALSGLGLDKTEVHLTADPTARCNSHIVTARGGFGQFSIRLDNAPLPDNPKSSAMTALALVKVVESHAGPTRWGS